MKKQMIDSAIGFSTLLLVLGIAGTVFLAPANPKPVVACNATSCTAPAEHTVSQLSSPTPAYVAVIVPEPEHPSAAEQQPEPAKTQQPDVTASTPVPVFQPEPTTAAQIQPLPTATIPQPQVESLPPQDEDHSEPTQEQRSVVEQTLQPVGTIVSGVTSLLK